MAIVPASLVLLVFSSSLSFVTITEGNLVVSRPSTVISSQYHDNGLEYEDEDDSELIDNLVLSHYLGQNENVKLGWNPPNPDELLSTPELLRKYGYPAESHEVISQDGFILTLHRIPHGRHDNESSTQNARPVIFLHHGLMCSSADWLMNTVDKALGYQLADMGYDVWLGNARGNTYSRKHIRLTPEDHEFWDFSFHEIGMYDIPATIDYIVATTGQQRITYIGHSMGTVVFWIAMSEHPQYNQKIHRMFGLGPVAFLNGTVSPIRYLSDIATELQEAERLLGDREFFPNKGIVSEFQKRVCDERILKDLICENILFLMCGFDRPQLNESMVPVIMSHTPAGTSTHTIIHFLQLMKSAKFRQFDFGRRRNLRKYGTEQPPEYDMSKVTANVSLFYGQNDWLADPQDVLELSRKLPNLSLVYKVKLDSFNHMDFLYAIDSNELLYNKLKQLLKN